MGAPQQQRKILRIGIIQGGRITEEQLIRHGQTVTIGDGQKNTFVLHSVGLPTRFPIFIYKGTQYVLAFTSEMDGKLSTDGVVMGFESVRSKSAPQKDGTFHFPLTEQSRGKVTIGGTTILFQFVPAPAAPVRGSQRDFGASLLKQIDSTYWGIFAISAIMHATIMFYSMSLPAPKEMTLEEIPDQFARFIVPARKPEPVDVPVADEGKGEEEKEEEKKEEEKKTEEKKTEEKKTEIAEVKPVDEVVKKAERKEALKKMGILRVLGSRGGKSGSLVGDIVGGGADTPGLEDLLKANPAGMRVATSGESAGLRGDVNDTRLADVGDVGSIGQSREVKVAKRTAPVPKLELSEPAGLDGNMDRGSLESVIKRNLPGVTACYDKALKLNPSLRGKIYIDFTVEQSGRVSQVNVRSTGPVDQEMADCIKGRVTRWKFPTSEEGSADVSLPIVLTATQS